MHFFEYTLCENTRDILPLFKGGGAVGETVKNQKRGWKYGAGAGLLKKGQGLLALSYVIFSRFIIFTFQMLSIILHDAYEVLTRKTVMQCISQNSFYQKRLKQLGNSYGLAELSIPPIGVDCPPSLRLASPFLYVMSLNLLSLRFSTFHKYNNYGKATCIVYSYPQSIHLPSGQTNSPRLYQAKTPANTF